MVALVALEVVMIAAAVAWVAFYSYVIHPSQSAADYEAYAQISSPVVSLVVGVPAFFVAGRVMRRRAGPLALRPALATLALFLALDVLALVALAEEGAFGLMVAANWLGKSAAIWLGARSA